MVKYRRTEDTLRGCLTSYGSYAIRTDESTLNGVYGNGIKFSGPISEPLNWMSQTAFGHELLNYTGVIKKSYGIYNETSGWYDEDSCLYSMQKNETDVSLLYVKMPVLAHGLRAVPPFLREYIAILSKYNVTNAVKIPDVFEAFRTAFDGFIWLVLALFAVAFIVLVKTQIKFENQRVRRRRNEYARRNWKNLRVEGQKSKLCRRLQNDPRMQLMVLSLREKESNGKPRGLSLIQDNAIYDVLTHLFQVETVDYELAFLRMVLLFITLLSFYIITYFGNLMSTDMVLAEEPAMIKSYQDLLDRGKLRMVFMGFQNDYKEFEYAPKGSIKRKLWDRSLESANGSRSDLFIKMGSTAGLASSAVGSITKTVNVDEKNRIELVAVFSSTIVSTARATACTLKAAFAYRHSKSDSQVAKMFKPVERVYSRVTKDPNERETLASPLFREGFRSPLAKRIEKRLTHMIEVGTLEYVIQKSLVKSAVTSFVVETPEEADVYRKCMTDDIKENMKKNEVISMKLEQFELLFYSCLAILVLALIVLCFENWASG